MAPLGRRRVLLIANPTARRHATRLARVRAALDALDLPTTIRETAHAGHATTIARDEGSAHDVVLTLGGDGTAMEVITALAGAGPPVGVLPGGTANVLARTLGVPRDAGDATR
ncbi:MAG TPA: acylglycerol kinase family protein, partial [Gemmatimonadaceae bacterium]|nr:acylglycerol kinase family protein [Gemmatimonadaceae bacterium]